MMSDQQSGVTEAKVKTPADKPAPNLPLFYKAPQPVNVNRHGKFGVQAEADLSFARGTNVLPVSIGEFAIAAKYFPLVFSAQAPHMPVAICGLRQGENVFVTDKNMWAQNVYVPAYVRRYPFVFMESQDREQMILCVDEGSGLVAEGGDRALFDAEGKQTETIDRAVEFCRMYHQQHEQTRQFVEAMAEHDLLTDNTTEIKIGDDRKIELKGYMIIDRKKLDAIDDKVFLDWRKRGWLPIFYYHLQSVSMSATKPATMLAQKPASYG
jgi:hypothetical protein